MKKEQLSKFFGFLAFLALIVFVVNSYRATGSNNLRLYFLDVGQGDAIFIETPQGEQILVDGGPNTKVVNELSKIMPLGDTSIDLVIASHNHADHIGGLEEVLKHYSVEEVWISGAIHTTKTFERFLQLIKDRGAQAEIVMAGKATQFGELEGIVLYPLKNMVGVMPDNQHDSSVVTYWQYGKNSWLLMGDAEIEHENELLSRGLVNNVDILKVGHHGSRTSSGENFLKATSPKIAVISAGNNNRYDHPHPETLEKLINLDIPILRTDLSGTIKFSFLENSFTYTAAR